MNKADEITAEEMLKIQGNLVWNVSPLMASLEPPTFYAGSFWSRPYKSGAPKKLLKAQEQSLLTDIKEAIDKRIENRIATARRFAVSCNVTYAPTGLWKWLLLSVCRFGSATTPRWSTAT